MQRSQANLIKTKTINSDFLHVAYNDQKP